jgi:hypothetical protein
MVAAAFMIQSICAAFMVAAAAAEDLVVLGDSWGEGAKNYLPLYCKGKTGANKAISGSTAKEWTE